MQGILESLLSADWVKAQLAGNAFEFLVFTALVFVVGVTAGYCAGRWRVDKSAGHEIEHLRAERDSLASKVESYEKEAKAYESKNAGLTAAVEGEKRKSAELARRWDELHSDERLMSETFELLNERELWVLSHVMEIYPRKFSTSGDSYVPDITTLCEVGILRHDGDETHGTERRSVDTISLGWRRWLMRHADRIPEPTREPPC